MDRLTQLYLKLDINQIGIYKEIKQLKKEVKNVNNKTT